MIVLRTPLTIWNWSIHFPSLSAFFNLSHSSTNQELFKKHLCNQRNHYEKYRWFPFYALKEAIGVQPPNQCFSLSAKMNGTEGTGNSMKIQECTARTVVHVCHKTPLGLKRHRVVKKIKPVALAVIELC